MHAWHKIQIDKEAHPKSYNVKTGDLIQCFINFALAPSAIISDIKCSVEMENIQHIGTVITSDMRMAGGAQRSAFFYAQSQGLCYVRLSPVGGTDTKKEYSIAFLVSPEDEA